MGRISNEALAKMSATKIENNNLLDESRGFLKECKGCGKRAYHSEDLEAFVKASSCRHGYSRQCKECKSKAVSPEKRRELNLQRLYGITLEDYDMMILAQDGKCAICETTSPRGNTGRFHVDHNHDTGEVRGLLCSNCNTGIGLLQDSSKIVLKALNYLERN